MPNSDNVKKDVVMEWRELGFYYYRDKNLNVWRLVGSKRGLLTFTKNLDAYVLNPRNEAISEHEHYGPYMYLEIMTWDKPVVDSHAIAGTLSDLKRLSGLIKDKLNSLEAPALFEIDKEYSNHNELKIMFEVKEDDFDPASADPQLSDYLSKES